MFQHKPYVGNPDHATKQKARFIAKNARRYGKLFRQPCVKCANPKSEAHHKDYSRPLDVIWLCRACHGFEHRTSHCANGHERTPENIGPRRKCKICMVEAKRAAGIKPKTSVAIEANPPADAPKCRHGHAMFGNNIEVVKDGSRKCRTCARISRMKWRESHNGTVSNQIAGRKYNSKIRAIRAA